MRCLALLTLLVACKSEPKEPTVMDRCREHPLPTLVGTALLYKMLPMSERTDEAMRDHHRFVMDAVKREADEVGSACAAVDLPAACSKEIGWIAREKFSRGDGFTDECAAAREKLFAKTPMLMGSYEVSQRKSKRGIGPLDTRSHPNKE